MFKVSVYQSGFQSDELNASEEVTRGNKGFSVETGCWNVNLTVPFVLAQSQVLRLDFKLFTILCISEWIGVLRFSLLS